MRGHAVLVVAAGVVAALLAAPATGGTTPPLTFEMSSGSSSVQCQATAPAWVTKTGQSCTIIQPAGGTAWCTERLSTRGPDPVVQRCKIRQASSWRDNIAYVTQVLEMKGGPSPQDATQIADVRQGNRHRNNKAYVTQVTKLVLGGQLDSDGKYWGASTLSGNKSQKQEAHQSAQVCQGAAGALGPNDPTNCRNDVGMFGDNFSSVAQKKWESQQAAVSGAITQEQDTEERPNECTPTDAVDPVVPDETANMCANVDQNSQVAWPGSGQNDSKLVELSVQLQNARDAALANQCQGFPQSPCFVTGLPQVGGLDHTINQNGQDPSTIDTKQHSFMVQLVDDVAAFVRKQDPKVSKGFGSSQGTSPDNIWTGRQTETQLQFEDGVLGGDTQTSRLEYFGDTSGNISASQLINQNGQTQTNSCSGMTCAAVLECTTAAEDEELIALLGPSTAMFEGQACTTEEPD